MSTQNILAKSRRLFVPVLMAGLVLGFVFASLSGVQAAPLRSYGSNPQLRGITVTASGGGVVSDTQPNQAPASGSKTVYFRDFTPGTITVTPDVTGTAPLTVVREIGLDGTTLLAVSSAAAPLILPMPDGPIANAGSQDVTFTLQNNLGASSVFTISFAEDKFTPTVGIIAPTAGQVLTLSAKPAFTIVMTATDPNDPEASGIQTVQVITGAGGAAQTGTTTDNVQWTYNWTLPTEENVAHTLLVTATDYVGNYVTTTRSITIDTQGPITTSVVLTSSHAINTWYPASTVVMTWTGFSDAGDGVSSYLYLWDSSASTVITPGMNGVASTGNVTHVAKLLSSTDNYYFHVAALDTNGNWSGTVMTGPFKIDTLAPTGGSISINGGATYANQVTVTLALSATDATSGLYQMAFSNDGTTWITQPYGTSANWTLAGGDGVKMVYARFADNAGNVSVNANDAITLDTVAPTGGSISINGGATYANQVTVTLALSVTDATSGLYQMAFSNDGTTWITQPYGTSANWTLASGDGVKTVYARFADNAGNVSGNASDTITLDTAAPTGGSISINAGATYATSTAVTLTLNASDAASGLSQMAFSNDGTTWITQPYGTSANWTLASGDGVKTVYVRFADNAGNVSGNANDTITLDTVAPTGGSISINAGATYATLTAVTLTLNASDATSGLAQMAFSNDGATWFTQTYGTSANWTLTSGDGTKTVYARFVDNAGNVSGNSNDTITLDTAAPTGGSISINAGASYANQVTVTLALSATDATSGLAQVAFSNNGTIWFTQTYATSANWTLTSGDGTKSVYARFVDSAANVSTNVSDTIFLDQVAPNITLPYLTITSNPFSALYKVGSTTLYYTNTAGGKFVVGGFSTDPSPTSGLDRATFSTAFGFTPTDANPPDAFESSAYTILPGTTESGLITATVFDKAGNSRPQPYTYQLDADPPYTGSISINAGAQYVSQTQVNLALLSADTQSGVAEMCLSNNSSCTTWETYATSKSWTLDSADGVKTVWVWFRDNLDNSTDPYTNTITLDQQAPTGGSVNINAGATYASSTAVTLTLNASDATSGLSQMAFSNDGTTWFRQTYATTTNWTLASGDGAKTVYVRFVDNAGNISGYASDTIILDTTAPTDGSISINDGAAYANQVTVTLALSSTDATSGLSQMAFSNDGTTWITQPYGTSANWTLASGDGAKTVYARFADNAGNISGSASDAITLDTTAPTGGISINAGAAYATSTSVTLTLSASDATSGLAQMAFSNDGTTWFTQTYATTTNWTLATGDGLKTVYTRFVDNAGNVSGNASDTITLDTAAPTGGSISINAGATFAASASMTLTLSASDATSGVSQMAFSNDGTTWLTQTYATTTNWTLASGDGAKTVYVRFVDNAGNVSGNASDTITLDTVAPTGGSISINGGATYANQVTVTLALSASDATSGLAQMAFSNDGTTWITQTYATTADWTLSSGDGAKTVYARFADNVGNLSGNASDAITLDTTAPTGGSVSINAGAEYATSTSVTLTLSALDTGGSGLAQMSFSNNGTTWLTQTYATTTNWILASGDGAKTVYARYIDNAGNVSGNASDKITLDTVSPVVTLTVPARVATLNNMVPVHIDWSGSLDSGSGVAAFYLSYTSSDGSYQPYTFAASKLSTTLTLTRDVAYTFVLSATDLAGNVSLPDQAHLLIAPFRTYLPNVLKDYPPLPTGSIVINNGAAFTYDPMVTLTPSATVVGDTMPPQMRFSNDSATWSAWEAFAASKSWTLSAESGQKTVYAQFKGSAGGLSQAVSDSILLFNNGNFEADWTPWADGQDGFTINNVKHGSGLTPTIVLSGTDHVLQLGNPAYVDGSIPVGYGYASQTFVVPADEKRVTLTYRVHSLDAVYGSATLEYFDTFEVSLQPPTAVTKGERDAKDCRGINPTSINPVGTLKPALADKLIFCGGAPKGNASAFDTGWKTVTIDFSNFPTGQSVTLYFAVWNREYTSPFYNDKGYYNTYAFVNDVRFGP